MWLSPIFGAHADRCSGYSLSHCWGFYYYFSVHLLSHISGMGPGLIYMHFFPPLAPSLSRTHCGGQTPILCSPLHFFLNCNCCNGYFFLVLVRCLPRGRMVDRKDEMQVKNHANGEMENLLTKIHTLSLILCLRSRSWITISRRVWPCTWNIRGAIIIRLFTSGRSIVCKF